MRCSSGSRRLAEGPAFTPEQIAEQIRRLKVSDLLVAETSTLAQIGYAKLGDRDLEQARLAIDALRALVPVLAGAIPEQAQRDFQQVVANLQLAYADAASQKEEPKQEEPTEDAPAQEEPKEATEEPEPEDAAG
jgi:hypothetical protein